MSTAIATAFRMGKGAAIDRVFIKIKNGNVYVHKARGFDLSAAKTLAARIEDKGRRVNLKNWTLVKRNGKTLPR